jgi:XTP/dITP diphosphohydrolase/tetrapyrrole methylase family protein/MazG family protein/ATP diphosphatase
VAEAGLAAALERLDEITRRLRRECPWDREQDERSIVPHTVEEAYELADAAHSGDDDKLLDELGDVLFQVYFLALLLEERGRGSLAEVAEHCRQKLIRRHPHVFGRSEAAGGGERTSSLREAETAGDVVRNWNQIKRDDERGGEIFGEIPETLPSTLYAKKILKRAESAGHRFEPSDGPGEQLLAAVREALAAGEDPELALRQAADRFRTHVEAE